jgi:ADP-ribosylglycohydrolase
VERDWSDVFTGVILGTAVGDALGLPREKLSRDRANKLFGPTPLCHRLFFGHGMVSDDTEQTCMVGQAILSAPDDARAFARNVAWRFRFWLLGLPAGIGSATLRAVVKLWLGFSPNSSGVNSAGNGPATRAAILGIYFGRDVRRLREYVGASTRLTHVDRRAEDGALVVALAAYYAAERGPDGIDPDHFFEWLRPNLDTIDDELEALLRKVEHHLKTDSGAQQLAESLGLRRGVTGYIYHTVPVALFCWLHDRDDFRRALEHTIVLGGDVDSTGAIVGALSGAALGASRIPVDWLHGVVEWPRSIQWMRKLGHRLASQFTLPEFKTRLGPVPLFWPGLALRNLLFLAIVLGHGFRRLFPPY